MRIIGMGSTNTKPKPDKECLDEPSEQILDHSGLPHPREQSQEQDTEADEESQPKQS